jgi:pentalenolactone synthase
MASTENVRQVTTPAGDPAWQVAGYANVKALLGHPRLGRSHRQPERAARYSEAAIFGQAMGSPETERSDHAQMRSLLTPSFPPAAWPTCVLESRSWSPSCWTT